jgi:hypothetical protein
MENPLVVEGDGSSFRNISDKGVPAPARRAVEKALGDTYDSRLSTDQLAEAANALGYDGLIVRRVYDTGGDGFAPDVPSTVYVVFDPSQIKSANMNAGTFDPADASMLRNPAPRNPARNAAPRRHNPAEPVEAFLRAYQGISRPLAANGYKRLLGQDVVLSLSEADDDTVSIDSIENTGSRKGAGGEALAQVVSLADRHGVMLRLHPAPFGERAMSRDRLVKFYSGFGFGFLPYDSPDDYYSEMFRAPRVINPIRPNPALPRHNPAEPRYTLLGVDEEVTTCEHCGKADLKCTVVLGALDADGNVEREARFGRSCAAKALRKPSTTTANKMESLARVAEYERAWAMRVGPGVREQVAAGRFPVYVTSYPLTDGRTLLLQESDPSFRPPAGSWTRIREGAWVGYPAKTNPSRSKARR